MSTSRPVLTFPASGCLNEPTPMPTENSAFEMVGDGEAMRQLRMRVQRIGPHFRTVLVRGEMGCGKELVARALHAGSSGAGPFVVCNAASLEDAASEGTDADWIRDLIKAAHRGTLFIDGIEEMPLVAQARLLAELKKWSGQRMIASSCDDLRVLAASGRFRQDLFHRIATVEIAVVPLRERAEDIPALANYFLRRFAVLYERRIRTIADDAMERMLAHPWPGNVREMENVIRNGVLQGEGDVMRACDLTSLRELQTEMPGLMTAPARLQDVVERHVHHVLKRCSGNKVRAADLLGISRSTLYRMLDGSSMRVEAASKSD